jgi:hypothetical protein
VPHCVFRYCFDVNFALVLCAGELDFGCQECSVRAVLLKLKCMYGQHGTVIYCPCFALYVYVLW